MSKRPDPVMFARTSYYLAIASSVIILIAFILSLPFVPRAVSRLLINEVWLALITGGAGTFMGYAARLDFKRQPGPEEAVKQARIGYRINLGALAVTALVGVLLIAIGIVVGPQG